MDAAGLSLGLIDPSPERILRYRRGVVWQTVSVQPGRAIEVRAVVLYRALSAVMIGVGADLPASPTTLEIFGCVLGTIQNWQQWHFAMLARQATDCCAI